MILDSILARIAASPIGEAVSDWARVGPTPQAGVSHAAGSLRAFLIALAAREAGAPLLCIAPTEEEAQYLYSDLHQMLGGNDESLLLFPPDAPGFYDPDAVADHLRSIQRTDALQQIKDGFGGIVVTDVRAVADRVVRPETMQSSTITVRVEEDLPPQDLAARLADLGFSVVDFVQEPGELARRGGILDVYPFTGDYPIRIEYFGDTIESLREFDPLTQRSVSRMEVARLVPSVDDQRADLRREATPADYLPAQTLLVVIEGDRIYDVAESLFEEAKSAFDRFLTHAAAAPAKRSVFDEEPAPSPLPPAERYLDAAGLRSALRPFRRLVFLDPLGPSPVETLPLVFDAGGVPQPPFHSNLKLLRRRIHTLESSGADIFLLCDNRGQQNRLFDLLELDTHESTLQLRVETLHEGFELPSSRLAVYTDHQIFNRYHRPSTRKRKRRGGISLRELQDLRAGDFVVHIDHGVGRFDGLERIDVRGKLQEVVRVLYQAGDVLYVNVSALHKLHKFTGQEGHKPELTRLGSGQWERTKSRAKKQVKEMARDLIRLYAERKSASGYAFSPDTVWQRELEAGFEFEDTPDQASASDEVKGDMERPVPMDRLVCGDVGFGKTEVAVRAAFKCVQEGKQVAVLVPTTVLADQHYETFRRRLSAYPVSVDMLSRFRSASEQRATLAALEKGTVDILIGTQRAVSADVRFKDLGLLIIDEEQRFGVRVKERLRTLRPNIDTLTLTATPIPRTLQFSLMGARDLSIISTPPPNRRPIATEIHTFDKDLIRDAILHEVSRGGQVFFIHNRVRTIEEITFMLRSLVENVRFQIGHGQMKTAELERVMHGFIKHEFDVLVCTNIVESGLDVPNANTMVIDHAERFGLADLHQLRGRVGRSDRKAFCYLLTPNIRSLTREARQRLQAVEEFADLGAGFSLSMRDLDIRGAGNMLGTSQSGFIAEIGFETFHRILDEAVHELRTEEFAHVFGETVRPPSLSDTTIDVETDALLPDSYVANRLERLSLYRRISASNTSADLREIEDELTDRFGSPPESVTNLLAAAEIKLTLQALRLPKIAFKNERLFLEMPEQNDDYFYRHVFQPLLKQFSNLGRRYVLKESPNKLRIIVQNVPDLQTARLLAHQLAALPEIDSKSDPITGYQAV